MESRLFPQLKIYGSDGSIQVSHEDYTILLILSKDTNK